MAAPCILLVNAVGKYWRMNYRFGDKRKTLSLGVYPDVGLAKARERLDKAREQLADGVDPAVNHCRWRLRKSKGRYRNPG